MNVKVHQGTTKYADLDGTFCRPKTVCTTAAHFVARRQIVNGGDEMCRQRRYNLSPATNCAITGSSIFQLNSLLVIKTWTVCLSATLFAVAKGQVSQGSFNYNGIILAAYG